MQKAFLVLEDGQYFEGISFGANTNKVGETVFNTSISGYQEILTDPSYKDQIITLTYPMIGNYGTNSEDMESKKIYAQGLVVKEYVENYSNFRATQNLSAFLKEHNTPGISGIDTRKLTRILRSKGASKGGVFIADAFSESLVKEVNAWAGIVGSDLAKIVSTNESYVFGTHSPSKINLAVFDYGVKRNILKILDEKGFNVHVFPALTKVEELLEKGFGAFFMSNGPGDPEPLTYAITNAKTLIQKKVPLFGICLGHQIIGQALGMKTGKLKFGHRGGNHPVQNNRDGKVEITAQNHGFVVLGDDDNPLITHMNIFDHTIAGLKSEEAQVMSVQYHPESSPGPHDSHYLFDEFYSMAKNYQTRGK